MARVGSSTTGIKAPLLAKAPLHAYRPPGAPAGHRRPGVNSGTPTPGRGGHGGECASRHRARTPPPQAKLNGVVLLQALSNGMGDLWQVMARELRDWGPGQCGQFASVAGLASMTGTLLTAPLLRLLGPRTLVLGSTAASASANLVLAHATTDGLAYAGIAPAMLGAVRVPAATPQLQPGVLGRVRRQLHVLELNPHVCRARASR